MIRVRELLGKLFGGKPPRSPDDQETAQKRLLRTNIKKFQRLIGHQIRNQEVFVQALLHRSFLTRVQRPVRSNERLEFLGDSILNLIVAEYLYHNYPEAEEGELTKVRSRFVNRRALAAYAKEIQLSDFILMSSSAAQSLGKGGDTILADTYEAVVAAVYLDGGYDAASRFVERQLLTAVKTGSVITTDDNFKSLLLELAQSRNMGVPRYTILSEEGPDHDRTFTVEVLLGGSPEGRGSGKNKKDAEQAAARVALQKLQQTQHGQDTTPTRPERTA
ncbi:MAG: ribonuclease III [Bacteroidota bacterium]